MSVSATDGVFCSINQYQVAVDNLLFIRFTMMQSVVKNDGSPGDQQEACARSELSHVAADDINTTSSARGSFEGQGQLQDCLA